jgi:hypothetical protein
MRLFEYDDLSLLASAAEMNAFQKVRMQRLTSVYITQLSDTYANLQLNVEQAGNVTFLFGHQVTRLISRTKQRAVLEFRTRSSSEL